ncbi:MAG: hypothetical protein PF542_05190 [Nanoarchaeota archaeon]|jgi:hypothetical protein|nr:hypothetical protein [Nanoarchaeota archaeon]
MKIKIKKQNKDGIVRVESSGDIKEFIFQEDFLNKENSPLLLCFRGKDSSGIIELSASDVDKLYSELKEREMLLNSARVMKFEK